uniref:hypothetical protein n=1 Tax=Cyanobium sp. TaxID=2164130 RepID=UPI004049D2FA
IRTTGDITNRNLSARRQMVVGSWTAQTVGGETMKAAQPQDNFIAGPGSIRQAPAPTRRWK